jgi:acetylornithine deacetylase
LISERIILGMLEKLKQSVSKEIEAHQDRFIDLLKDYIQHKSINPELAIPEVEQGGTQDCQFWLRNELEKLNCFDSIDIWEASPNEYNIAANLPSKEPESGRSILFNGHSDVVPVTAEEYETWIENDPWSGLVYNGSMYGRGACDMKGPNISLIWAAYCLRKIGFFPSGRAVLTFTIGEESGNAEIGPLSVLQRGYSPDIIIVAESTELKVCPAAVGWFFFRIDVKGEAAHAASRATSIYPSDGYPTGINAIEIMLQIMDRLRELEHQWGIYEKYPLVHSGTMAMNPVEISGGGPKGTTPDTAHAAWGVVINPDKRCTEVKEEIARVVNAATVGNRWLEKNPPKITFPYLARYFEPVNIPLDHPAVKTLVEAVKSTGKNKDFISCMPTPSDANLFFEAGKPTIVFGPGNLLRNGVHGLNEHIQIESLIAAAKIYANFLIDWCSE